MKMKKLIRIAILALAVITGTACAADETYAVREGANSLYRLMTEGGDTGIHLAMGYIEGIVDSIVEAKYLENMGKGAAPQIPYACIPAEMATGRLFETVFIYFRDHPEHRKSPAASLVVKKALVAAYPCK